MSVYGDYKLVEASNGREMWYKNGQLVGADKVPEQTKELLRNPEPVEELESAEDIDVQLAGFKDIELPGQTESTVSEKHSKKARLVLKKYFPELEFHVNFRPKYKNAEGRVIKDRYNIDVTRNGQFLRSMTSIGFNLPVLKEQIEQIFTGTIKREKPQRRKGSPYLKKPIEVEKKNLGERRVQL